MLALNSARRRATMRSSLSGMASMAAFRPDGAGPIRARWRRRLPPWSGSSSKDQLAEGWSGSPTAHENTRPGSQAVTVHVVSHSPIAWCRLRPAKRAPCEGPVEPSSHRPPWNSDEYRAGRLMSAMRGHTRSGPASMWMSTSTLGESGYRTGLRLEALVVG